MKESKHAFLVLAHNEFGILKSLIQSLDYPLNDIFIHFDRKVHSLPEIQTRHSNIFVLDDRVDVAWGDVSVVEAEYKLFESSSAKGPYEYYHLISGVDLPLMQMDQLHTFFGKRLGKEFIGFSSYDYTMEVERKINYIHLFPRYFRRTSIAMNWIMAIIRAFFLRFQMYLFIKRNKNITFKKGTQWVSVTDGFVQELLNNKSKVLKIYKNSFCADEIYKQTICWNTHFKNNIYCIKDESEGSQRKIRWENGMLRDWNIDDYEELINSNRVFARKFSSQDLNIIELLLKKVL